MCDVQSREAEQLGRVDQLRERTRLESKCVQIKQAVTETKPLRVALAFVQRRLARRLDAGADQADQEIARMQGYHAGAAIF